MFVGYFLSSPNVIRSFKIEWFAKVNQKNTTQRPPDGADNHNKLVLISYDHQLHLLATMQYFPDSL